MNKNTVCKECGKHFVEREGIFVIKPDVSNPENEEELNEFEKIHGLPILDGEESYNLCDDCFKKKYNDNTDFKTWYDNDTRVLDMDADEISDEFGGMGLEELSLCSYWTQFEDEGDDDDLIQSDFMTID